MNISDFVRIKIYLVGRNLGYCLLRLMGHKLVDVSLRVLFVELSLGKLRMNAYFLDLILVSVYAQGGERLICRCHCSIK